MLEHEATFSLTDLGRRFSQEYRINLTFDGVASMTSVDTLNLWDIPRELVSVQEYERYQNMKPKF